MGTDGSKREPFSDDDDERGHHRRKRKSKRPVYSSDSEERVSHSKRRRKKTNDHYSSSSSYSESSESVYSESDSGSGEEKRKKRKRKRDRRDIDSERDKKRREKKRKKEREEDKREKKRKKKKSERKKEKLQVAKKGAVTDTWGKYGTIREIDMWNKRPEFTAWLAEVKQVNLESLANWEEKQMFKDYMEDYNTATFPSKKYYNLDAYYSRKMEKQLKKGVKKVKQSERTVFNDEEQRRIELLQEREKRKEEEIHSLKRSMQGGMAQAMKEQAQLREEMAYQYKLGNFEAAAAIQRRLDPDVAL